MTALTFHGRRDVRVDRAVRFGPSPVRVLGGDLVRRARRQDFLPAIARCSWSLFIDERPSMPSFFASL